MKDAFPKLQKEWLRRVRNHPSQHCFKSRLTYCWLGFFKSPTASNTFPQIHSQAIEVSPLLRKPQKPYLPLPPHTQLFLWSLESTMSKVLGCNATGEGTTNKWGHTPDQNPLPLPCIPYDESISPCTLSILRHIFFHILAFPELRCFLPMMMFQWQLAAFFRSSWHIKIGASYSQWHPRFEEVGWIFQYLVWEFSKRSLFPARNDHLRGLLSVWE